MTTPQADLMAEATALDEALIEATEQTTTDAPAEQAAPTLTAEQEAQGLIEMAVETAAPLYPTLRAVYTPETVAKLSAALGPLMRKYSFSLFGASRWKEELQAAMVCVPVIIATVAAVKADTAARENAAKVSDAPAAPAPAGDKNEPLTARAP